MGKWGFVLVVYKQKKTLQIKKNFRQKLSLTKTHWTNHYISSNKIIYYFKNNYRNICFCLCIMDTIHFGELKKHFLQMPW
jgi:hypothetical protein